MSNTESRRLASADTEKVPASSDERSRRSVESVVDYGILTLDVQGCVTSWTAGAARMKGYAVAEVLGRHVSMFYPAAEVLAGKCERDLAAAEALGCFEEEGLRVRKDGSTFWANLVLTAVRTQGGALVGYGLGLAILRHLVAHQVSALPSRAEALASEPTLRIDAGSTGSPSDG